jgi:hypothetical protein
LAGQDGRLGTTDVQHIRPVGNPLGVNANDPLKQDDVWSKPPICTCLPASR